MSLASLFKEVAAFKALSGIFFARDLSKSWVRKKGSFVVGVSRGNTIRGNRTERF